MRAVNEATGDPIYFSMSDIVEATDTANAWIAGFLAGSEPDATTMFGVGFLDDDDDPRWERWTEALSEYRRSGEWPHERWQHLLGVDGPSGVRTLRLRVSDPAR